MEFIKLLFGFLKVCLIVPVSYFFFNFLTAGIVWICGLVAIALILDLFKKNEPKEDKKKLVPDWFREMIIKNKTTEQ